MANKAKREFERQKDGAIKQASARLKSKIKLELQKKLLTEELLEISRISEERRILLEGYDAKPTMKAMQKVWLKGKRGGAMWEIWVVQLICELLIIGVPPSVIPSTINTVYDTLYGFPPKEVPCVNYVRQCRTVVQVIGETISAIKLGKAADWVQMSFDGTTRRHIPFQCLIISIMKKGTRLTRLLSPPAFFLIMKLQIVSRIVYSIRYVKEFDLFLKKNTLTLLHLQITSLKQRLEHLRKKVCDTCPQHVHLIPHLSLPTTATLRRR